MILTPIPDGLPEKTTRKVPSFRRACRGKKSCSTPSIVLSGARNWADKLRPRHASRVACMSSYAGSSEHAHRVFDGSQVVSGETSATL